MGLIKPSKGRLLYRDVRDGKAEGIRALRLQGADLEWRDKDGQTPLILACSKGKLYHIVRLLIELGANVNAHPRAHASKTPLYNAAINGLENTVKLLLLHGANECQIPLQIAINRGFSNVVRAIERHICLFSGWMREFYRPTFFPRFVPKLSMRNVWVVIVPTGTHYPHTLKLAVYDTKQNAQPRTVMNLWVPNFQESNEWHSSYSATILGRDTCLELVPGTEGDIQQLERFCDACKGIPQPRVVV